VSQLDKLSTDSGFNGVNLLQGDHLKVQFNEKTGAASNSLDVSLKKSDNTDFGVLNSFNLGIGAAATTTSGAGIDFKSNTAIDTLSDTLTTALSTIQTQSSSLGANLSVVQTRQDFTKQIIDVLKTGSGNLTDADMNEEAANSQALSTRQSIGISALSLANTANQGILQLLR
jgi:flagellin-like hook-associated protein FlgL